MGILNATPDSFFDGGAALAVDDALRRAEQMISQGADIIDVGGESTRPGSSRVSVEEEIGRVLPVIEKIREKVDVPVSIDTSKAEVARRAIDAGAEIINDVSGLQFDPEMADAAAESKAGLVVMHLRGGFETMHRQEPVEDIFEEVSGFFRRTIAQAAAAGVARECIALDPGIGFSKTPEQNLELIGKLGRLIDEFHDHPVLIGASRKSFIGKILDGAPADQRLSGSLATAAVAVWNGAKIVRVHDVRETVETVRVVEAIRSQL